MILQPSGVVEEKRQVRSELLPRVAARRVPEEVDWLARRSPPQRSRSHPGEGGVNVAASLPNRLLSIPNRSRARSRLHLPEKVISPVGKRKVVRACAATGNAAGRSPSAAPPGLDPGAQLQNLERELRSHLEPAWKDESRRKLVAGRGRDGAAYRLVRILVQQVQRIHE